jgi:hypothetical protein
MPTLVALCAYDGWRSLPMAHALVSMSVAQVVPCDVRVPVVPTLLQLRKLFDGIPICRTQRTHSAFIPALKLLCE